MDETATSFKVGRWTIDGVKRTAVSGDSSVSLSTNEVGLLTFLAARNEPVQRAEILTEVFGYAPSVRSRAADMAINRLRSKLERDPGSPEHLRSKRGVGVWLEGLGRTEATAVEGPPRFGSPYVPRPEPEAAVHALWNAGWRVVTVVGAGGAGKTRLTLEIARGIEGETVFVPAAGARSFEDLLARLASRLGVVSGELDGVARALATRGATVVLDEAEEALDACRAVVSQLASTRFLVSSRQGLQVEGEGIHALQGLSVEDGRAFLRSRLAASRWSTEASDALMDRVRDQVDGLPLGLELAAAYPDGLEVLVEELESGRAPTPGAWLESTLTRSLAPLEPETHELLCALSIAEGALTREDVTDWRGPDAAARLIDLADRSLLQRSGRGWALLRTVRAAVRRLPTDWVHLQRDFDAWLLRRTKELGFALDVEPGAAIRRWRSLESDFTASVDRAVPSALGVLVRSALPFFDALGPRRSRDDFIRRAFARAPEDPTLLALSAILPESWGETQRLAPALADPDPDVGAVALHVQADVGALDPDFARDLATRMDDSRTRTHVEAMLLQQDLLHNTADPEQVQAFLAPLSPHGIVHLAVKMALARHVSRAGDPRRAAALHTENLRVARAQGLTRYAHLIAVWRAISLGDRGLDALRSAAVDSERSGADPAATLFRIAELCYATGDLPGAADALAGIVSGLARPRARILATHLEQVVHARLGGSSLDAFAPGGMDAAEAEPIRAWYASERCLLAGDPEGAATHIEPLREAPLAGYYSLRRIVEDVLQRLTRERAGPPL